MFTLEKSRAETQLAISQMKATRIQEERDTMRKEKAEKKALLKTLRLAKESTDENT